MFIEDDSDKPVSFNLGSRASSSNQLIRLPKEHQVTRWGTPNSLPIYSRGIFNKELTAWFKLSLHTGGYETNIEANTRKELTPMHSLPPIRTWCVPFFRIILIHWSALPSYWHMSGAPERGIAGWSRKSHLDRIPSNNHTQIPTWYGLRRPVVKVLLWPDLKTGKTLTLLPFYVFHI